MPNVGFQEIAGHLRDRISAGAQGWCSGDALPSEAQLLAEWGVTRTTIRRALGVLEGENLIEAMPGRGRYVRSAGNSSRKPAARFEIIAATLREEISRKPHGARLDRETKLAERFQVAQGTIRQALGSLEAEGLIHAAQGQGWFVGQRGTSANRTDEVAGRIRVAISSGALLPGQRLPGELALAKEYEVGRVTVRRALAKLEADGLIEKQGSKGRIVAMPQHQDS